MDGRLWPAPGRLLASNGGTRSSRDGDVLFKQPPGPTAQNSESDVLKRTLTRSELEPSKTLMVDQLPSIPSL